MMLDGGRVLTWILATGWDEGLLVFFFLLFFWVWVVFVCFWGYFWQIVYNFLH